ncbi:CCC motif membrane protein [Ferruginibacter yonginensis]|uniref:CCC motif membrane protein n=1 Tax=Ferruginibacter yonginensis TaxID=1310416 RepID=A0ABV8QUK2_9BACT
MDQRNYLTPNDQPQLNLPNATASLVLGIISILGGFCYGFVGVICGIIGLVLANKDRRLYNDNPGVYSPASLSTSNSGRICSIIGLVIGAIILLIIIFYIIFFGAFFMEAVRNGGKY